MPSKAFKYSYYVVASLLVLLGAVLSADLLWGIADIMMGLMTLINLPIIIYLGKYAFRALADYKRRKKDGAVDGFDRKDIGLDIPTDYWSGK